MRLVLASCAAVLLLALAVWWTLRAGPAPASPPAPPAPPPTTPPVAASEAWPTAPAAPAPRVPPPVAPVLTGQVRDEHDGRGVAGARVRVGKRQTTTGDDGGFSLAGLDVDRGFDLLVQHPAYATARRDDLRLEPLVAPPPLDIVLSPLPPGGELEVCCRGLGESLAPRVRIARSDGAVFPVEPDGHGRLALVLGAGEYEVRAEADGFPEPEPLRLRLEPGERRTCEIRFRRAARIAGAIRSPTARTDLGLHIHLRAQLAGGAYTYDQPVQPDAEGRFSFDLAELPQFLAGPLAVRISALDVDPRAPEAARALISPWHIVEIRPETTVDLTFHLEGTTPRAAEQPRLLGRAPLAPRGTRLRMGERTLELDEQGRFELQPASGPWPASLVIEVPGREPRELPLPESGGEDLRIEIEGPW